MVALRKSVLPLACLLMGAFGWKKRILKNVAEMEYLYNEFEDYNVIYDYDATTTGEIKNVTSPAKCRWMQFSGLFPVLSVSRLPSGGGFECRLIDKAVMYLSLVPKPGNLLFFEDTGSDFRPATDGLFYHYSYAKAHSNNVTNCCTGDYRNLPMLKSEEHMEMMKSYLEDSGIRCIHLGGRSGGSNHRIWWEDQTEVDTAWVDRNKRRSYGRLIWCNDEKKFSFPSTNYMLPCVCIYNPFSFEWSY